MNNPSLPFVNQMTFLFTHKKKYTMKTTNAHAVWTGTIKGGNGKFTLPSTGYETAFTFASRFQGEKASNPEELIGAALAGCFSMALSLNLEEAGAKPENIDTNAEVSLVEADGGFAIDKIELDTKVKASGVDEVKFMNIANETKEACPVSKALKGVTINLEAILV
jgi:osmotically inducible protein OsmC